MDWSGVVIVLQLLLLLPYNVLGIALSEPLVDTNVIIGDTATLSGTITDNPERLPISWRRQDTQEVLTFGEFVFSTQLYVRRRYSIQVFGETYNLIISNVEMVDEGEFEIGYVSGNAFVPLTSTTLNVNIPPDAGFPVCDATPAEVQYLVGQTLTLSCQTKGGKPKPDIVWLRNGVEVARTSSSEVLNHALTLGETDNGALFECNLDGRAVTETLSCQVRPTVTTPTVDIGPSVVVIDEGSDAVFNCDGQGAFSPTFDWTFPTHIRQSNRYAIGNSQTRLTILETTIRDNNAVVRCEMKSSGKIVAGRSATLLIRPKPTTVKPTTVAPTTVTPTTVTPTTVAPTTLRETTAPMTTKPATARHTTTVPSKVVATTEQQPTTSVATTTKQKVLPETTKNTPIKPKTTQKTLTTRRSKTLKSRIPESPTFTRSHMTIPNDVFITTPSVFVESKGTLETTMVPVEATNGDVPKQKSDNRRRNGQHLGLIFAAATAMIIVLTIVVFAAFCLIVCKAREKKDTFNVSNNASSLAGSTGPPYNNGIFRANSEYRDDYELTDNISQQESQASATESAAGVTITVPPENLYTLPAKLGKTTKIYHPASSSQPDFSTFRLTDDSLRYNTPLSSKSLDRRPKPVPAPKPPRSYGEYENLKPNYAPGVVVIEPPAATDVEVVDAHESTPLRSAVSPDPIQSSAIYENRSDIRDAVLLEAKSPVPPKQTSPVVSTGSDYTYEDILKIADSFLHDLEQLS